MLNVIPLFLLAQVENGTSYNYKISEVYNVNNKINFSSTHPIDQFLFHESESLISIKMYGTSAYSLNKDMCFQKFDASTLELINSYVEKDFISTMYHELENIIKINDRICIFYSLYNKEEFKEQLFVREIDCITGQVIGSDKLIIDISGKLQIEKCDNNNNNNNNNNTVYKKFRLKLSPDSSKIFIHYEKKISKKDKLASNNNDIGLCIINTNFEIIWKKEVKLPYIKDQMKYIDFAFDKKNRVYILATVSDQNSINDKLSTFHLELFQITSDNDNIRSSKIEVGGKQIKEMFISELSNGNVFLAGFYSYTCKIGKDGFPKVRDEGFSANFYSHPDAKGIFTAKVGANGEIIDVSSYDIPIDIINQYESEKQIRKNNKKDNPEIEHLGLKNVIILEDQSSLIIGERSYSKSLPKDGYSYHFDDILVAKINYDGKLTWMKKIPKKQIAYSNSIPAMSFKYFFDKETHNFLFKDNKENADIKTLLNPKPCKSVDDNFYLFQINDDNGDINKSQFIDNENTEGIKVAILFWKNAAQLSANRFVFEALKIPKKERDIWIKKEHILIDIDFNKK